MRCTCCDRLLSDYESTRKSKTTGEYLDMCNKCYSTIKDVVPTIESVEHNYEEEVDVPAGYTADELDRDNPYNQWMFQDDDSYDACY